MIDVNKLEESIRSIPDFPEPGIIFRDITTLLQDADAFNKTIDGLCELIGDTEFDAIGGLEARGFLFGAAVAYKMGKGLITIRKKGKLPCETISQAYSLEYGTAEMEIHTDAVKPGMKVILIDDLLATGGTINAGAKLVERLGAEVAMMLFVIELKGLGGREFLKDYKVGSLIVYDGK